MQALTAMQQSTEIGVRITTPLTQLHMAMDSVSEMRFTDTLKFQKTSVHEIQLIQRSFEKMKKGL